MTLAITCPCGARLEIDEKFAGQIIQCPDCQRPLQAPTGLEPPMRTSGLAIASVVLALLGAFTVIGTLLAVILGALALRSINRHRTELTGGAYALAGIVLGVLLTGISLFAYLKSDLFGLDRLLREPLWAGKLDYSEPLSVSCDAGFTITRPSSAWGVYRPSESHDRQPGVAREYVILVNVGADAQAIGFAFRKDQLLDQADTFREEALHRFAQSELLRVLSRQRGTMAPIPKVRSKQELPGEPGQKQEVVLDVKLGRHERTFVMRIFRGLDDQLFVVAAGTRTSRFHGLESQLKQIVTTFKLERQ